MRRRYLMINSVIFVQPADAVFIVSTSDWPWAGLAIGHKSRDFPVLTLRSFEQYTLLYNQTDCQLCVWFQVASVNIFLPSLLPDAFCRRLVCLYVSIHPDGLRLTNSTVRIRLTTLNSFGYSLSLWPHVPMLHLTWLLGRCHHADRIIAVVKRQSSAQRRRRRRWCMNQVDQYDFDVIFFKQLTP